MSLSNAQSSLEQSIDDCLVHGDTHVPILDASCPKGRNCTFPPVETLGICSSCNDVTSSLILADFKFTVPVDTVTGAGRTRVADQTTTYDLPDGSQISYTIQSTLRGPTASSPLRETLTGQDTLVILGARGDQHVITNGRDGSVVPLLTVTLLTVRRAAAGEVSRDLFENGVKATQCSLVPCVQTLDVQVRDGHEIVRVVDEWIDTDALRNGDWLTRGLELSKPPVASTNGSQMGESPRFVLGPEVAAFLQQQLIQQLNLTKSLNTASAVSTTESPLNDAAPTLFLSGLPGITNAADAIESVAAMATTFLHRLGSTPPPSTSGTAPVSAAVNPVLSGTASTTLAVISIRWGFFAVPLLALVLAAALFPLAAISTARRHAAPLWKDEPLALLFHGVELGDIEPGRRGGGGGGGLGRASRFYGEKKRAFDVLETASGMRQVAGDVRVVLGGDGGGSGGRRLMIVSSS